MCLATFNVDKWIFDLACNSHDTQIAVIENPIDDDESLVILNAESEKSILRIYDVGRPRIND